MRVTKPDPLAWPKLTPRPSFDDIHQMCHDVFGVRIQSRREKASLLPPMCLARHLTYTLAVELKGMSSVEVGDEMGSNGRSIFTDKTSVYQAIMKSDAGRAMKNEVIYRLIQKLTVPKSSNLRLDNDTVNQ